MRATSRHRPAVGVVTMIGPSNPTHCDQALAAKALLASRSTAQTSGVALCTSSTSPRPRTWRPSATWASATSTTPRPASELIESPPAAGRNSTEVTASAGTMSMVSAVPDTGSIAADDGGRSATRPR